MENSKNSSLSKLIPVMLCFFAMGFVDLVGIGIRPQLLAG